MLERKVVFYLKSSEAYSGGNIIVLLKHFDQLLSICEVTSDIDLNAGKIDGALPRTQLS